MTLEEFFRSSPRAAVAFSGGTDSAFLLWAAREYGCDVEAYYVKTAFQPEFELKDAKRLAEELDIPMKVIRADILAVPEAAVNGPRRCYYCKRALFTLIWEQVRSDGHTLLLDGTNASDDAGDRPGMQALRELEVRSPLRECGITKEEVRRRSKEAGIFTWNKPALRLPCHADSHRNADHSGRSEAGGRSRKMSCKDGIYRFSGASHAGGSPASDHGRADASGI